MKPYYEDSQCTVFNGDCREVLAEMEPDSVDCCVTSPPYYGLRKYSGDQDGTWGGDDGCDHEWGEVHPPGYRSSDSHPGPLQHEGNTRRDGLSSSTCRLCGAWRGGLGLEPTVEMYVEHIVEVFRAVKRVLKPTGTMWVNIGDSYAGGNQGGVYKPGAWKELPNPPAGWTNRQQRTNGMNTVVSGLKPKDLMLVPFRLALALQAAGWWIRSDIIWAKNNPMPESVTDRPTTSHEHIFLLSKRADYYFDQEAVREKQSVNTHERYAKGRPVPPAAIGSKELARPGYENWRETTPDTWLASGRNIRTVWTIPTEAYPDAHFATFPQALVRPCILAGTSERGVCAKCGKPWQRVEEKTGHVNKREPAHAIFGEPPKTDSTGWKPPSVATSDWRPTCRCEGDTHSAVVLDIFGGSGTTGLVARKLGRRAILIELSEEYCRMSERRILALPEPML